MENCLQGAEARLPKLGIRKVISVTFSVLAEKPLLFLFLAVPDVLTDILGTAAFADRAMRFFFPLMTGAVGLVFTAAISAAAYAELSGGSIGLGESLRRGIRNYFTLFCAWLPYAIAVQLLHYFGPSRDRFPAPPFFHFWRLMPFTILFLYLCTAFYTLIPVCVAEGLTVVKAYKRCFSLTKGYRGRIFILMFFYVLAVVLLQRYAGSFFSGSIMFVPDIKIVTLVRDIFDSVFSPIMAVCVYFLIRIKKEHLLSTGGTMLQS